ncbi:alpha/beta hydrolase, partial [Mesorhizobium sp. M1E.F.Ca.ET.063.01.1.1]
MSFRLRIFLTLLTSTAISLSAAVAQTLSLKPFKDDLFGYPATLSSGDNGAYTVLDYREMRDINQRDEVPEKRVHAQYTEPGVRKVQQDLMLKTDAGDVRHVAVGKTEGAAIIVLYLHGQGGSRKQGVDDFTFGGNFNRIKNLMAENGGLYLSPDFPDFGDKGAAQVSALIDHYAETSPSAKIFVACGSMGGMLC